MLPRAAVKGSRFLSVLVCSRSFRIHLGGILVVVRKSISYKCINVNMLLDIYGRTGRYRGAALIGTYGPQAGLPDIRCALAAAGECDASTHPLRPCQARFEGLDDRRRSHAASPC